MRYTDPDWRRRKGNSGLNNVWTREHFMRDISALRIMLGTILLFLLAFQSADAAATNTFTTSFSGTIVSVALDIDNDSCTSTSPSLCTDLSGYSNYSGNIE